MKLKRPTVRTYPRPDWAPGILSVISRDGKTYTEKAFCGCVVTGPMDTEGVPDWNRGRVTTFCGTAHPDPRNEPGYPRFIPKPKKLKIKKRSKT